MADDVFLTGDSLLNGLSTRRSTMLLFAIESRTARLMMLNRPLVATYVSQEAFQSQEEAFYEAIAGGRDLPLQPSIQDIERYALQWSALVPEDSSTRAGVANLLKQKYTFSRDTVPQLRAALGLESAEVSETYTRIYSQPVDSIYVPALTTPDRLHWLTSRAARALKSLPPFWVAFVLTLPLGSGLLALPTSMARIGTLPALALLIVFGLFNIVTVAGLAETMARSGTMRYGLGFLGQLVSEYLGTFPSLVLTIVLAVNNFLVLVVFYFGIGSTLQSTSGIPAPIWFVTLAALALYFLSRPNVNSTVAFSLVVAISNFIFVLMMLLGTFPHLQLDNLTLIPGQAMDASILQLVFGALLTAYIAHTNVANFGGIVIRRNQDARQWIRGCVAAVAAMIVINCVWLIAVNGAVSPAALAEQTGTAIEPLVALVGPVMRVVGSLFVILSLGITTLYVSLGLYFLVRERLPALESRLPLLGTPRWKFALSGAPVIGVLIVAEWLAFTGSGSFSALLAFLGVIALPLITGFFPILLLIATRHKGEYVPGAVLRLIGNRVLLTLIYSVYLAGVFAYGLVIWQTTIERALTLMAGVAVVVMTFAALRGTALRPRLVVEVKINEGQPASGSVNIVEDGRIRPTPVVLRDRHAGETRLDSPVRADLTSIDSLGVQLTPAIARELKVWVHRLTGEGTSLSQPFALDVETEHRDALTGILLIPCRPGQPLDIRISLPSE